MPRPAARLVLLASLIAASTLALAGPAGAADGWKAGTARATITPRQPLWMAGYGSRSHPSEGAVHDLWAKALVLEDPSGKQAALVTLDVCGIDRDVSLRIREAIKSRLGIDRERVVLACSHTHCGPALGTNLITMYRMDEEQLRRVEDYTKSFEGVVIEAVVKAAAELSPAALSWGTGRADFAVNRRTNKEADVPALRERLALQGPSDHDVPVLRVAGGDGRPRAIVFGYACHCTVLSFYKFCGDYAGFAQLAVEANNPGAQAMFVAGCGGDQNPLPRRTVALAEAYGNQLARSVQDVVRTPMNPITSPLGAADTEIPLAFAPLPTREQIEADAKSKDFSTASRARMLLKTLDRDGKLAPEYPYPVQAWSLGDLTWVFLGGEAVVDYSLRIKRNLGSSRTWVSAYCNDVCCYIPSLRVLKEGGYEGATSMIPYGRPTVWSEKVEEDIVAAVNKVVKAARSR